MSIDLNGHSALVTGATQGVGAAIAAAFESAGAAVLRHGLDGGDIEQDLMHDPVVAARSLADQAFERAPNLDVLVCNAGTYIDQPFLEMESEVFDRTMKLNVYSTFFLAQAVARRWVADGTRGRMVLVGSINGILAEPDHSAYDTSKGAIEMMVKSLCVSLAPHGIRVNGLAPGLFETPLTAGALADPALRSWMAKHTPNGEVPGPEVCGDAAVYLVSDAARHVHGHMLRVDGGMSAWQQPDP